MSKVCIMAGVLYCIVNLVTLRDVDSQTLEKHTGKILARILD